MYFLFVEINKDDFVVEMSLWFAENLEYNTNMDLF